MAKAPADRRTGAALGFEVAAEALDVGSARLEQVRAVVGAPVHELAQVQGVGIAGEPAAAGKETGQG